MLVRRALLVAGPFLVVALAVVSALSDAASGLWPLDLGSLGQAGDRLLSAAWLDAFAERSVQVGPLWLVVLGVLRGVARALDASYRSVFAVATEVGVAIAVMCAARSVTRSRAWSSLAGAAAVIGGIGWTAYISGHPEEVFLALLWVWAAQRARAGEAAGAGLLIGTAAALKPTGALGLPLLLLLPSQRTRVAGVSWAAAMALVVYLPFLAFGTFRMFGYRWPVDSAVLRVVLDPADGFPWWMRFVQGAAVCCAGAAAVVWLKRSPDVVWCAPMVIVATRIALDPQPHHYFWLPFEALALVGAASLARSESTLGRLLLGSGVMGLMLARYLPPSGSFLVHLAIGAALILRARASGADVTSDPAPAGRLGSGGEEPVAGPGRAI